MKEVWSFALFASVAITVYGLLNFYFIRKFRKTVGLESLGSVISAAVLSVLVFSPIVAMLSSRLGPSLSSQISSFVGYGWLAFLFLFLVIHGTTDVILFFLGKIGLSATRRLAAVLFWLILAVNASILMHGAREAERIEVERLVVRTNKLPSQAGGISIMLLSDVHFSPVVGVEMALKIQSIVIKEKPDIIVSVGDLLDPGIRYPEKIVSILRSLPAPLGKYAVAGNHEFYTGISKSLKFTERAGFQMLRNQAVSVGDFLAIAGVDDPEAKRFGESGGISERELLSALDSGRYIILLKHRPMVEKDNFKLFDLQLSGHTHGGQIFPFSIAVKLAFPYLSGLYELDERTLIYVSRGVGTWGPSFRLMASPEITAIELKSANGI